jgi:hypothetical protein
MFQGCPVVMERQMGRGAAIDRYIREERVTTITPCGFINCGMRCLRVDCWLVALTLQRFGMEVNQNAEGDRHPLR